MSDQLKATMAIFAVFFLESAVLGSWIPRIPDIKETLSLSDSGLGLCLLSMPMGTFVGLLVAGKTMELTGVRRACQLFLPLWALLFILPALAETPTMLVVFLFLCGISIGLIEVAMNTEADRISGAFKRRIMSKCHGFWSFGSMAGALVGGVLAQLGWSVQSHFFLVLPLIAIVGFFAASALPRVSTLEVAPNTEDEASSMFRLPSRGIVLLCILPMGAMAVEGTFIDWSGVFMDKVLNASPLTISVVYSAFAVVMAITRLLGDRLAERYGDFNVVRASGCAATLGIVLFAWSPNVPVAFIAAAISGMGVAIVYPLCVSAAAQRPGRSAADNVAALSMISFTTFLIAPPLIGFVSDLLGLRWALFVMAPVAMVTFLLAAEVKQVGNESVHNT